MRCTWMGRGFSKESELRWVTDRLRFGSLLTGTDASPWLHPEEYRGVHATGPFTAL